MFVSTNIRDIFLIMESFLITFLCGQLVSMAGPQYNTACTNFTNATFIQTGLHNDLNGIQGYAETLGTKEQHKLEDTTGKTPWEIATAGYVSYNTVRTKSFQFSTSAKPLANSFSMSINGNGGNITLGWNF